MAPKIWLPAPHKEILIYNKWYYVTMLSYLAGGHKVEMRQKKTGEEKAAMRGDGRWALGQEKTASFKGHMARIFYEGEWCHTPSAFESQTIYSYL